MSLYLSDSRDYFVTLNTAHPHEKPERPFSHMVLLLAFSEVTGAKDTERLTWLISQACRIFEGAVRVRHVLPRSHI